MPTGLLNYPHIVEPLSNGLPLMTMGSLVTLLIQGMV